MQVILYQPQIPQNAGNIVRTCAVTGCDLLMVRPLGFSTHDRWLKRAGLDYWEGVNVSFIDDLDLYLNESEGSFYFFSSKATTLYSSVTYQADSKLIFGSETAGLPSTLIEKWPDRFVHIPMIAGVRCLNLATSVGIGVYEAWRQQGFQ
jgi:tRNA (cytidine/uridine-2'-O-)-methyltransferase